MSFVFPKKKRQISAAAAGHCSPHTQQRTRQAMPSTPRRASSHTPPRSGVKGTAQPVRFRPSPPPRCAQCAAWPPHGPVICALFLQCHACAHSAHRCANSHARRNVGGPKTWKKTRFGGVNPGMRVHGQGQGQGQAAPHAACPGSCMGFKGILKYLGCLSLGAHSRPQSAVRR